MTKAVTARKRDREEDAEEGTSQKKQQVASTSSMAEKDVTSLRKREREEDLEEGPSSKRQEVGSSTPSTTAETSSSMVISAGTPSSNVASNVASNAASSMVTSTGTRSTTAIIRAGVRSKLSVAQRGASRRERAAGKRERNRAIKNPEAMKPCPSCVKANCYNPDKPHSSSRYILCPSHKETTEEWIARNCNDDYRRYIRKHGLRESVILDPPVKEIFLRLISEMVDDYRQVAIKSQLFASYYIRRCLSQELPLPHIVFNQAFFYACIQKVIGRNISNTNVNLPRQDMDRVFDEYSHLFPNTQQLLTSYGRNVHANALASLANQSASNLVLHVSSNYKNILQYYIKTRLQEVFVSVNTCNTFINI